MKMTNAKQKNDRRMLAANVAASDAQFLPLRHPKSDATLQAIASPESSATSRNLKRGWQFGRIATSSGFSNPAVVLAVESNGAPLAFTTRWLSPQRKQIQNNVRVSQAGTT